MPQDDDLFVNDDLNNSAENRLNHVLFGLFINRHFREHVLQRLGVPDASTFFKPANRPWRRPAFAIESSTGALEAYVEVELDKNEAQLERYKANAGVAVYSFGRHSDDNNITLDQLVEIAKQVSQREPDPQWNLMVRHFTKQVDESAKHRSTSTLARVQLESELVSALREAGMVNLVEVTARPGGFTGAG